MANLRQRCFCKVRSFIAVRYAEKRMSFKLDNERVNSSLERQNDGLFLFKSKRKTDIFGWSQDVLWSEWLKERRKINFYANHMKILLDKIRNFIKSNSTLPWIFHWCWKKIRIGICCRILKYLYALREWLNWMFPSEIETKEFDSNSKSNRLFLLDLWFNSWVWLSVWISYSFSIVLASCWILSIDVLHDIRLAKIR